MSGCTTSVYQFTYWSKSEEREKVASSPILSHLTQFRRKLGLNHQTAPITLSTVSL